VEGQTRQAMDSIGQILKAAGPEHTDVVFTNVYFLDPDGTKGQAYANMNQKSPRPHDVQVIEEQLEQVRAVAVR